MKNCIRLKLSTIGIVDLEAWCIHRWCKFRIRITHQSWSIQGCRVLYRGMIWTRDRWTTFDESITLQGTTWIKLLLQNSATAALRGKWDRIINRVRGQIHCELYLFDITLSNFLSFKTFLLVNVIPHLLLARITKRIVQGIGERTTDRKMTTHYEVRPDGCAVITLDNAPVNTLAATLVKSFLGSLDKGETLMLIGSTRDFCVIFEVFLRYFREGLGLGTSCRIL